MNFNEGEMVRCRKSVTVDVIGDSRSVSLPANSVGAVVTVYRGSSGLVEAYEIEFCLDGEESYALATVDAKDVERQAN